MKLNNRSDKFIATLLVTCLVGPAVGILALGIPILINELRYGRPDFAYVIFLFGYPVGILLAAPCGLMMSVYGLILGRLPFWLGPVTGLASYLIVYVVFLIFSSRPGPGPLSMHGPILFLPLCIFAGFICWLLVRRFWTKEDYDPRHS
jgi:hypothetical protein